MTDRPLADAAAERNIIAACMASTEAAVEACELLRAEDFNDADLASCFEAVTTIFKGNAEPTYEALSGLVQTKEQRNVLTSLTETLPDTVNVAHYAQRIIDAGIRRRLVELSRNVGIWSQQDQQTVPEIINKAHTGLLAASERRVEGGPKKVGPIALEQVQIALALERGDRRTAGLETQFLDLNTLTGGFHPGELTIVAARPGVGKTVFLINLAQHFADRGTSTLIMSLEMRDSALVGRMLAAKASINSRAFRAGGYLSQERSNGLVLAADFMADLPVWVDERVGQTPSSIRMTATRMRMQENIGAVLIDYLGLVRPNERGKDNRARELSFITQEVREMSKALSIPVIAAHQLNRGAEDRAEGDPQLSDLKDSGGVEEHADCVIFLHRNQRQQDRATKLIVAKQREGPVGSMRLTFQPEFCCFKSWIGESAESAGG